MIRAAAVPDAAAIAAIYNEGIRGGEATFETVERTAEDIARWFATPSPFLVATTDDGRVRGWIRASEYRPRDCYAGVAEFSVYVKTTEQRQHVGDALMRAFLQDCAKAGYWKVLSRIFPENTASLALCARHGFRVVGLYEKHGRLNGQWRDVTIVERLLSVSPAV